MVALYWGASKGFFYSILLERKENWSIFIKWLSTELRFEWLKFKENRVILYKTLWFKYRHWFQYAELVFHYVLLDFKHSVTETAVVNKTSKNSCGPQVYWVLIQMIWFLLIWNWSVKMRWFQRNPSSFCIYLIVHFYVNSDFFLRFVTWKILWWVY